MGDRKEEGIPSKAIGGDSMNVGDLVKMKGCNLNIIGLIVEVFGVDESTCPQRHFKIVWLDDLCDPSFATAYNLERLTEN